MKEVDSGLWLVDSCPGRGDKLRLGLQFQSCHHEQSEGMCSPLPGEVPFLREQTAGPSISSLALVARDENKMDERFGTPQGVPR